MNPQALTKEAVDSGRSRPNRPVRVRPETFGSVGRYIPVSRAHYRFPKPQSSAVGT
jgi:hypothetical protein